MSDNIPFEIQSEIMKRVPVKSLLQFRSVSKTWKSLIDTSAFIASYRGQHQHMLVYYDHENRYVSIVDDATFPHQKVSVHIPVDNPQKYHYIIGCSHGLLCVYGQSKAVIWNISVRKGVTVVVPNLGVGLDKAFGFGVCRETSDPKIVKITYSVTENMTSNRWQVVVFTLSTGVWRRLYRNNVLRNSIQFLSFQRAVTVGGVLYWRVYDRILMDGGFRNSNLIISFDLTTEEFKEVNLPDSLAHHSHSGLSLFNLRESLVVYGFDSPSSVVWMMEDGVRKSFTKLFSINLPAFGIVRGFRKSDEPIFEIVKDHEIGGLLAVYEPNSENLNNLGIDKAVSFSVYPYKETLLLLDKPDLMVDDDI